MATTYGRAASDGPAPACLSPLTRSAAVQIGSIPASQIVTRYCQNLGADISSILAGIDEITAYRCTETDLVFFAPSLAPSLAGDERLYQALQRLPWYYQGEKAEFAIAANFIRPGSRVLEVGCGSGAFAKYIPSCSYTGIETSSAAVARAASRGVFVEKANVADYAGRFDVVCAFQVLEHVPDPWRFLEAMRRLTVIGGKVVLAVPNADSFVSRPGTGQLLNLPPHHLSWWSRRTFEWLGRQPGWEMEACETEPLAPEHCRIYRETVIWGMLRRIAFYPPRPFEVPHRRGPLRMLARLLAEIPAPSSALGHTLLAVFRRT